MNINSPIFCNPKGAYIYIWVSKNLHIAYVGQTHAKGGVVSRAAQHIKPSGTLQVKLSNIGLDWADTNDWAILYYELPREAEFQGFESSYRLAVEYLVQIKLYQKQEKLNPRLKIISTVRSNFHTNKLYINDIAEEIINNFIGDYAKIANVASE